MKERQSNTIRLIKAVLANRFETVRNIVSEGDFNHEVLKDVLGVLEIGDCDHDIFSL